MKKKDLQKEFECKKNVITQHCLDEFKVVSLNWSPATLKANESRTRVILNYLISNNFDTLDLDAVNSLILHLRNEKKHKNKTVNEYLTLLRHFTSTAVTKGLIDSDPMIHHPTLKVTRRKKKSPVISDHLIKLINNPDLCPVGRILVELGCRLGMRISEILALAWTDLDEARQVIEIRRALVVGQLKQTKTSSSNRKIKLNQSELELFKTLKKLTHHYPTMAVKVLDEGYDGYTTDHLKFMFLNLATGRPYKSVKDYEQVFFNKALERSDIDPSLYSPNVARHTFASTALSSGIPAENVARQLGHTSTEMVRKHYASIIEELEDKSITEDRQTCFDLFTKQRKNDIVVNRSHLVPEQQGHEYSFYSPASLKMKYS